MKHATAPALDKLAVLLGSLREIAGLTERKPGVFYRKSASFLHFHEDPAGLFADVRTPDGEFARYRVSTSEEQARFLHDVTIGLRVTK